MHELNGRTQAEFWEHIYNTARTESSGRPSRALERFVTDLPPGRSLDLGCAHGDDVFWLAARGWRATGADISTTAIERARKKAGGLAANARFERHDLATSLPDGPFDLVTAFYLQSPGDFDRIAILRRAADTVAAGGLLLVVTHASVPPWSWADPKTRFATPEENLAELDLPDALWHPVYIGAPERTMLGPDGQSATVRDTILALRRHPA